MIRFITMKIGKRSLWVIGGAWIVFGLLADAYTSQRAVAQSQTGLTMVRAGRIGVMPFLKGKCGAEMREILDCPLLQLSFNPERLSGDCDRILTGYVHEALRKRHGERVISLEKSLQAYKKISRDEAPDTLRTLAKKLGEALEVNFMVVGTVWRYEERSGGPAGSFSPASVAFAVYLIDVASGRMVWNGNFNETQRSLSDNVLDTWAFFKKGAKWLSASELARYGVGDVFKKFPL
jgi:hypothetical protein